MIAGWHSNSGYSLLRGLRALAQTISYKVRLALILPSFVVLICRYKLIYFYSFQVYLWLIFFLSSFIIYLIYFLFSCLLRDSNLQSQQLSGCRRQLWPRGHWDHLGVLLFVFNEMQSIKYVLATAKKSWNLGRTFSVAVLCGPGAGEPNRALLGGTSIERKGNWRKCCKLLSSLSLANTVESQ